MNTYDGEMLVRLEEWILCLSLNNNRQPQRHRRAATLFGLTAIGVCSLNTYAAAGLLIDGEGSGTSLSSTRLYTFEHGVAGSPILVANDQIDRLFTTDTFDGFVAIDSFLPGTNNGVPRDVPIADWINENVDPTPAMEAIGGIATAPTFIDVSDGSELDSPSMGSTLAASFDGNDYLRGPGFRDTYVDAVAFTSNEPTPNDLSTFIAVSQAYVRPSLVAAGIQQSVWAVGAENGGVSIVSDGERDVWQLSALGPPGNTLSTVPVEYDEWTHLAVFRSGGAATLYVNGVPAAQAPTEGRPGFFNVFGPFVTVGADENLANPFFGTIDKFNLGGNSDTAFRLMEDLDFFIDGGVIPEPQTAMLVLCGVSSLLWMNYRGSSF